MTFLILAATGPPGSALRTWAKMPPHCNGRRPLLHHTPERAVDDVPIKRAGIQAPVPGAAWLRDATVPERTRRFLEPREAKVSFHHV